MRSVRTTLLSASVTTALTAGLSAVPATAQANDDAADVVTDWSINALGAIRAARTDRLRAGPSPRCVL
jgi:hypothetical protein